jgi:hypothetical protein
LLKKTSVLVGVLFFLLSCGDHSKPTTVTANTSDPIINITSAPYVVVVNKDLIIGIETKFAEKEPLYSAIPLPIGIAIVNGFLPGQIVVTGIKAGSTTFTITDQANIKAVPRTILVTVNDAPKLKVKPNPLTGTVGATLLVELSTLNQESVPIYGITINDSSVARILDPVNNPNLIDLIKIGTSNVLIEDKANGLSENFTLTVTP